MSAVVKQLVSVLKGTKIVSNVTPISLNIGTHSGSFHCDEVLAISMLKCLPEYEDATVVRSRDPSVLAQCSIVVDVGAIYDPSTKRYDHHQREFTGVLDNYKTRLSSAGLVYKHYGNEVISHIIKSHVPQDNALHSKLCSILFDKVYRGFIEHVDAIDNGISVADESVLRYNISTTLSNRVGYLNPEWNEDNSSEFTNERFKDALLLVSEEFCSYVERLARVWWPARSLVESAVLNRFSVHSSGSIILLDHCPWKDHLFDVEKEVGAHVLYAVFADTGGSWRVQCVPEGASSFTNRKSLPEPWCGVRDSQLDALSGIEGCIFVHASGFIGGNKTKEGALAMAIKALSF